LKVGIGGTAARISASPLAWSEAIDPNVLVVAPDLETPGDLTTLMNGIPEFRSLQNAIDNDFNLRSSLLTRGGAHSSEEGGFMPAYPTTVSLRSDAAEAPTTRSDCGKRLDPEGATAEAFFHSWR
jgi:hypothetical protein